MIRALYSAASGMTAQQMNVDNIANNLANANTAGFKMRRAQFQDLLYQNMIQPGAAAGSQTVVPTGLQLGLGTRPSSNEVIFTQGNFQSTEARLPVAEPLPGHLRIVKVIKTQEKGSDVNLATFLLLDAFRDESDKAVVIRKAPRGAMSASSAAAAPAACCGSTWPSATKAVHMPNNPPR